MRIKKKDLQSFRPVPLKDEILNLWNDFLAIIDFIQANPDITKIIVTL